MRTQLLHTGSLVRAPGGRKALPQVMPPKRSRPPRREWAPSEEDKRAKEEVDRVMAALPSAHKKGRVTTAAETKRAEDVAELFFEAASVTGLSPSEADKSTLVDRLTSVASDNLKADAQEALDTVLLQFKERCEAAEVKCRTDSQQADSVMSLADVVADFYNALRLAVAESEVLFRLKVAKN